MKENELEVVHFKKVTDFPKNTENPFLKEMVEEIEPGTKRKMITPSNKELVQTVYNGQSGEFIGHTAFMQYVEVDEKQFAKLYLSNIAAFWDLNKSSIRVFSYIMSNIKPNQDKIYFILEECIEFTGYKSKTMIFSGLASLLENKIIARGRASFEFYINPLVVFNGNRITFAKTYIKKKLREKNDDQLDLFGDMERRNFKSLKQMADKTNALNNQPNEDE